MNRGAGDGEAAGRGESSRSVYGAGGTAARESASDGGEAGRGGGAGAEETGGADVWLGRLGPSRRRMRRAFSNGARAELHMGSGYHRLRPMAHPCNDVYMGHFSYGLLTPI